MLLTEEERRKFVAYLEQDAASNAAIATQLEKLHAGLAKQKRMMAAAQTIVALELARGQEQTIG